MYKLHKHGTKRFLHSQVPRLHPLRLYNINLLKHDSSSHINDFINATLANTPNWPTHKKTATLIDNIMINTNCTSTNTSTGNTGHWSLTYRTTIQCSIYYISPALWINFTQHTEYDSICVIDKSVLNLNGQLINLVHRTDWKLLNIDLHQQSCDTIIGSVAGQAMVSHAMSQL